MATKLATGAVPDVAELVEPRGGDSLAASRSSACRCRRRSEADLEQDALVDAPGEARHEIHEAHLPAILLAQGRVGALLDATVVDGESLRV